MEGVRLLSGTILASLFLAAVQCQLTCNFEEDTCQWKLSPGWIRSQGKTRNLTAGSVNKKNSSDGSYLHLDRNHIGPGERALVISPPILDTTKKYCLSFLYLMHGSEVGTLSVHVRNISISTEVWAASSDHGPEWLYQEISIEHGRQVIYESIVGGQLENIGIDEITIKERDCQVKTRNNLPAPRGSLLFNCTFEDRSWCGFRHNNFMSFDKWEFGSGSSSSRIMGPDNDHTLRTRKGHYIHVALDSFFSLGTSVSLESPSLITKKGACAQFWYNMYGSHGYALTVAVNNRRKWRKQHSQGYGWKSAFIPINGPGRFKLEFTAEISFGAKGDIAIDDVTIVEGKCPKSVDCTFENILCEWSDSGDDDFNWSPRTGKRPSKSLGPSTDHTIGSESGTYMIIESKPPRRQNDLARLVSTTITEEVKTHCLTFWYNMNGKDVGELRVYVHTQRGKVLKWRLIGPQGGLWAYASLPIYPKQENFWFVIEGVVRQPSNSYIAFDDIALIEGKCKIAPNKAAIGGKSVTSDIPVKPTPPLTTVNPSKIILSCNFTDDFCGWHQGKHDKADWIRTKLATPSLLTGPQRDHTTGKGGYIYVEASNNIVGAVRLFSPTITPKKESMCLHFWYYMYGKHVDALRVFISPGTDFDAKMNPHWKQSGSHPQNWIQGNVYFQMKQDYQIVFEASLNGEFDGDIAIDDILLEYGSCNAGEDITTPKPGITEKPIPIDQRNCDFESNNICGYEHVTGSPNYFWRRNTGETESPNTGPSTDHTTNTAEGHYMYIEGSKQKKGTVARMITPLYKDSTSVCLQFYYHMYGSGIGNFTIYTVSAKNSSDSQQIYFTSGNHGTHWSVDRVTIDKLTASEGYKIMFEATVGNNYRADIALDDVSFTAGECSFLGDCTFEEVSCTWDNVKTDDFDWELHSGKTATPRTGPEFDHTLGDKTGHYMYIETSPPVVRGMKAQLVSAVLPKIDSNMCLMFWYNMYGNTVDSLKVIMQVIGSVKSVKWHLQGDQGKGWHFARVPLQSTTTSYTITFEASSGVKYTGDIAIDDISFTENKCQISPANAKITTTVAPHITTPAATTPAPVHGNFSCNFDKDLCGWTQDTQDSNEWHWHKGRTDSSNTGPPADHTTGSGHYIYLETSRQKRGSQANLISPLYKPDNSEVSCISFWYYMYGAHVKSLRVYIQYGMNLPSSPTWSEDGNKGQHWILGKFPVKTKIPFNVVLSAVVGQSYEGDIAVDDVSIINGDCSVSDSNAYLMCDFEKSDVCGFNGGELGGYRWKWHHGRTQQFATGPNSDHTFGTAAGHYMYIKGSRRYSYSRLMSPQIITTSASCVQFYYHMKGNVGRMTVYLKDTKGLSRQIYLQGHQSREWQLASFEVPANVNKYNVYFDVIVGPRGPGDIAIDDFSVLKGSCSDQALCNFEKGMCIWENSNDDDFDWIIKGAGRRPDKMSPGKDHTINAYKPAGHYLYASTDHNRPHTKANIETSDFGQYSKNCLRFWFSGHGQDPGTLSVYLKSTGNSDVIWQLGGTKAAAWPRDIEWHDARVQLPQTNNTFTLSIEVVVGKSGYVAIDDIMFDNEKDCSRIPSVSKPVITKAPPTTIPTTPAHIKTTPKKQAHSFSCDFTDGFCGWTQDEKDDINWKRINRSTPTSATGPSADHTTGSGYYIYIESTPPTKIGDVARLVSPKVTFNNKKAKCLTFWYNMHGEAIGTLSVLFLVKYHLSAPIWKRHRAQGSKWLKATVNIPGSQSLQVVFEANSGKGHLGDIALDDIVLHEFSCHGTTSPVLPSCDFEGTCNYKSVMGIPYIPWIITSSTNHPNISDHTYGTTSGEFMYVNTSRTFGIKFSLITTPPIKGGHYCLEFFYRSIGHFPGTFSGYITSYGVRKNGFYINGRSIRNEWTIQEVPIFTRTQFTFTFKASSNNRAGALAVDDIVFTNGNCPKPGFCDFERGNLCHWKNDPANHIDWVIQSGKTPTPSTGPISDHTKGNPSGAYAFLEASGPAKPGDRVRLISQQIVNARTLSCFRFWYFMKGSQVGSLSVSLRSNNNDTTYWRLSSEQGNFWQSGQFPIPAIKGFFQIVIEATVAEGRYGDIAIDDLSVGDNGCGVSPKKATVIIPTTTHPTIITTTRTPIITGDNTFNCTFENGTCGWIQSTADNFDWTRNRGYTPSKETGPQGDHTTGRGYYMYMEADGRSSLGKATLSYIANSATPGMKCMQFWYSMRGSSVGQLNIYINTEIGDTDPVWTKSGTQGPAWNVAKIEFNATSTFKVSIEGIKGHGTLGDIAIDDFTLINGGCKEPYGDCDFETFDKCGYKNDPRGDFGWTRARGRTSTLHTGPNNDHTYGTRDGHYMYIESSPQKPNQTARLISPVYKSVPDEHCLQFYYNMYGSDVGALNIKIRVHNADNTTYDTNNYLSIVGEQGADWKLAEMELPKLVTENPYQLMFEGIIGNGYRGDIAIDDIIIKPEECEIGGDCDFENGVCTWMNAKHGDDFDWMVGSGATTTPETGPLNDHTLQTPNGFYIFIDASTTSVPGQKAWYVSKDFEPTFDESRCLTFWYSMNGVGVGTLRVLIVFETGGNNTLWELERDQGNDWMFAQTPIKSPTPYKIIFEAIRGPNDKGDIALDDILFTQFSCSVTPSIATPRVGKQTLPVVKGTTPSITVVAGLNCTFDFGSCGWTQDTRDNFDWTENKGETPESGTGPNHDHTSDGHGFYFYIDSSKRHRREAARLISPLLSPNGLQCFTVWYHMYGSQTGAFNIYIFTGPNLPSPSFHMQGSKGNHWHRTDIQFNSKSPYNVILEGIVGWGRKGNIAVDDVSLTDGVCADHAIGGGHLCTFERQDICGYKQDKDDNFNWRFSSYANRLKLKDHTHGTMRGHYMFITSYIKTKPDQYASISSPFISFNSTDACVEFWYHMDGAGVGTLRVSYLSDKDNFMSENMLWIREGPQGNRWLQGLIDIDLKKENIHKIQLRFYGIIGPSFWKIIALDDVKITSTSCKRKQGDCDFEKGLCNWMNSKTNDFDWTIGSGLTTTTKSGPVKDHTRAMQAGSYLYMAPVSEFISGEHASLVSEKLEQTKMRCFQFYYYMNGAQDGGVEVSVIPAGKKAADPIWRLEGHQSENWTMAQINLPLMPTGYQVMIKGVRRKRFQGQIAIDDLSFTNNFPCKTTPTKAKIVPITTTSVPTTPKPIAGISCTFDKDFCGWQNSVGKRKWTRRNGKNINPSSDHTGGGFFIYIDTSGMMFHSSSIIYSPDFTMNYPRCLSFYYYMAGEDLNTLTVGVKSRHRLQAIWKRIGSQGNRWNHATVNIPAIHDPEMRSIYIQATGPLIGATGFIAVDDISLLNGECLMPKNGSDIDCDFENSNFCGYTQEKNDHYDWSYGSGVSKQRSTDNQPNSDHTYGTRFGHYMYINSSRHSVGQNAVLWTPKFQKKQGSCLTFWYYMSGSGIGSLEVYFSSKKNIIYRGPVVWMRRGNQNKNWMQEYIPITQYNPHYVSFKAVTGSRPGGIAIDDIKLLPSCPEPGDCTFESNTCGWQNAKDNDINWQYLALGHYHYFKRVPNVDHTTNGAFGHIMYFSSHRYTNRGKKGDLLSVSFDPTGEKGLCLEFWFLMEGYKFGNLTVFKQSNSSEKEIMWQLSVFKSSSWTRASFYVASNEPYQIGFRAVKGSGSDGFIALDDINYSGRICAVTPKEATPDTATTVSPSPPTTTHPIIPHSPYDCAFEKRFCKWTQATDDDFDWSIGTKDTDTDDTGPLKDHTLATNAGHYAFIETSSPRKFHDKARLISPPLKTGGPMCLSFWYHMYGEDVDALNIYVMYYKKTGLPSWSRVGTLNRKWYEETMSFYASPNMHIVFEAVCGNSYKGDIALDDISFKTGHCPENIKSCNFENGDFCYYKQSGSDNFDWFVGNGSSLPILPHKDHTYRTNAGHFMYALGNHKAQSKAQIIGHVLRRTSRSCVRFWYNMKGPIVLNVYSMSGGQSKHLANYISLTQPEWISGSVDVTSLGTWEVVFEANTTAKSASSFIAIDDVTIDNTICGRSGDCTFETSACEWRNLKNDDFDWVIKQAYTPGSGPPIDHTIQNNKGSYFYIDGSRPRRAGDKAVLKHTFLSLKSQRLCMSFWYSMHGGTLEISMLDKTVLWRHYGDIKENVPYQWKLAQLSLPTVRVYGAIIITGTIGSGADSYIAFDDVLFKPTACKRIPADSDPAHAKPPTTITPIIVTPPFVANSSYDCTFEKGICSWTQSTSDNFNWRRWHGSTRSTWTGPDNDHTIQTAMGWYIYIETSKPQKKGDIAELVSPAFKSNTMYCFMFYYFMYGGTIGKLNVVLNKQDGSKKVLWTKSKSHGKTWLKEAFRIPSQSNQFTVSFEGIVGGGIYGDIAIDDVHVTEGECKETGPLNCTFESAHLCGYKTPTKQGAKWRQRSEQKPSRLGPSKDHTVNTADGTYMYLEWDYKNQNIAEAQLISPPIKGNSDFCMEFYYHASLKRRPNELRIYQQVGNNPGPPIWTDTNLYAHGWTKGQVTLPAKKSYNVIFKGKIKGYDSSIEIDDISTVPGLCEESGNCDFERDMCTWSNMEDDQLDWLYGKGDTRSRYTGPSTDHTTGQVSGQYIFLEASGANPGDKARLRSTLFMSTDARCLQFWYHMYGRTMGTLKIYFVDGKSGKKTAIWSLTGNQSNKWLYAQVAFAWNDVNYIIIEGICGQGSTSDIAIDDIGFSQDYCATTPTKAQTDYVFPKAVTVAPTPTATPTELDCTFETTCSWKQSVDDDFDWKIHKGTTTSLETGPDFDHTLRNKKGHYIYIETSMPRQPNDVARFESPSFIPTQTGCLTFWYVMHGPDVDTLAVYQKYNTAMTTLWTKTGDFDVNWHKAIVPVQNDNNIQIIFEGRRGKRWQGDIAIDDISFSFKGCPSFADAVCNFEKSSICEFTQSKKDVFDWIWFQPGSSHISHQNDHTSGTMNGHYMLASGSGHQPGETATIISPNYSSNNTKCVEVWYHMSGEKSGTLNVYMATKETRTQLWSRTGDQGAGWSLAYVTLRDPGTFHVELEAVVDGENGLIAIDDYGIFHGECPKLGDCNFERGWCTWNNNRTDDFDWQMGTGHLGMFGAPYQDHTTNSVEGHFIFLQATFPIKDGARAVLDSEMFTEMSHTCGTFWYFMKEANTARLNVYVVTSRSKELRWTLDGSQQRDTWMYARFPIRHGQQPFKIVIEGIKGAGNRISIAVDDIVLNNRRCAVFPDFANPTVTPTVTPTANPTSHQIETTPVPTPFDCTFEKGMCLWKQDTTDNFDWIRSQGPMGSNFTGPLKDHTLGTDEGWYVYTDTSPAAKNLEEARLIGPLVEASQNRCLNFWYRIYGFYMDTLFANLSTNGVQERLWERSGYQGESWVEAFINLPAQPNTKYQIIFGSIRSPHASEQIALDDIRFTEKKCHENNPNFCDFEDAGLCGYTQRVTDDFDWTWGSGRTPTFLTGPIADHTMRTKHGHYMYIESSKKDPYQKAQIMSPKYNSSDTICFHFYYYMYGEHIDRLNLYKLDSENSGELGVPIWSRKYNQGSKWVEGQTSIYPSNSYNIIFEGVIGKGSLSDIAIDDISMTNGPCDLPGFCDFEKDFCTWKNLRSDQFDWLRGRGNTDTSNTGPSSDHTLRNPDGYYIYIETSNPQAPGDTARIQSEDFLPSNRSLCLSFWYQMYGEDVDTLNVLVQNADDNREGYVWSQQGDNGPGWLYAQLNVDLVYTNKPYHLIFEGVRGGGHRGDIAIDDVGVSIGECDIVPTYADPKQIAFEMVECSFDDGKLCHFQQSSTDDYNWEIIKGKSRRYNTGPRADHSGSGYYIYMKYFATKKGLTAVLSTPTIGPTTGKGNCFTFYYHMYGAQVGTLNIYMVVNGTKTLRWTKSGGQGDSWKHAHFNINSKFNYQLIIEGVTSGGYYDTIALDDFAMDGNPCAPARICDFSLNLCGWILQKNYRPWQHAMTPTPIVDHSTGTRSGGFLYTNATAVRRSNTVSRVLSPSYPPTTASCLKFWYYMFGSNPGDLYLQIKLPNTERRVWQRTGTQGDLWWLAHVDVGQTGIHLTQPYKFAFEAQQKSGPKTDGIIAIDDVEHLPGPCSNNGVCDFEQDLCGLKNLKGDGFDWIRTSNRWRFHIKADHTLKTSKGHYLSIEGRKGNKTAWLASWTFEKTKGKCLKFWYIVYGLGTLNVQMWSLEGKKTLLSESGRNGLNWQSASVTLRSEHPFVFVFEGIKGLGYNSIVAIDDIDFLDGSCETQTTPSVSLITQPPTPDIDDVRFSESNPCYRRVSEAGMCHCIPASMLMCDFERGFCGWKQDTTENTDWIRTTGESRKGGPLMDHTNDNDKGGYIMVKSSTVIANRTARIISDIIYQDLPVCLNFWYHMEGENPGTLNVYVKNSGEKTDPVWTKFGDQGMAWRYAEIEISKPEKTNKIYFEAIRGLGYGDISLDDVDLLLGNCPPRDFCDFEEPDICGYEQGDTDVFDWTWGSGRTPSSRTGPKNDHTYGTHYGHYMFIETTGGSKDDHAHLYSPVYPATNQERCFSFWYSMYGRHVAKLNVYLYQNNEFGDLIWSMQTDQGQHWHLATVPVKSETPFQVVFEGIRGKGVYGDIAIDDVKLSKEACDPLAFCTFEESTCGWENLHDIGKADFDWQRTEASSVKRGQGPTVDHTIGEKSGSYMLINKNQATVGAGRLRSQTIPFLPNNPKSYCFHFWHNLYDTHEDQLNVIINYHGDVPRTIWSYSTPKDITKSNWKHEMVLIESPYSHFELILEGVSDAESNNYIAVDDLQLLPGICPNMEEPTFTCKSGKKIPKSKVCDFVRDCLGLDDEEDCGDCTFEDNTCTWTDISTTEFNWTRHQGPISDKQKINTDHTEGTAQGWYIYADAFNARYGDYAILQNRALQQTSASCQLNFWYYMSGRNFHSLTLTALEGGKITELWQAEGYDADGWIKATADIGKISRPFKLQFKSVGTITYNGFVAVDDIELQDCEFPVPKESCSNTEFQCNHKGCVDNSRVCDLSDDCGDGSDEITCENYNSCDFETSLCSWSQDKNDNFDWIRQSEPAEFRWKGPTRDHSKGTVSGYYIYAAMARQHRKYDKARLIGPTIEPPGHKECWIRFFYHMRASSIGSLNLYIRTSLFGPYQKVWSKHGHVADDWERADVKLFADTYFQAVFETVINGKGNIALDDITLTPGCTISDSFKLPNGTETITTPSPCTAGLFQCKNSACILQSQVCDFTRNCKDGSDENSCGSCDFENWNNCGWKDQSTGRFEWQSHQGKSPGKVGPSKDHTSKSEIGKYMMVLGAYGVFNTHALLETQPIGATGPNCQVEFYVFMMGPGVGEISLNIIDPITKIVKQTLAKVTGNQGAEWKRIVGTIGAKPAGFALQFDALPNPVEINTRIDTDMAIDDVKLFNCEPKSGSVTSARSVISTRVTKKTLSKTTPAVEVTSKPNIRHVCANDSFSCQSGNNLCFPLAFLCDGHSDCPNNYDEVDCLFCPIGEIYCPSARGCIDARRCDGNAECPDGSDETACECRDDFCANSEKCQVKNGIPECLCMEENVNFRCVRIISQQQSSGGSKKVWKIPVGIIVSLILIAIVVGVSYFLWIKRKGQYSFDGKIKGEGIPNPAYDYGTNLPSDLNTTDDLEPPMFSEQIWSNTNPNTLENPLYSVSPNGAS